MIQVRVFDIRWDFDKGEPAKPQGRKALKKRGLTPVYILNCDDDMDVTRSSVLCDIITNDTGFLIFGASYEIVPQK